MESRSPVLPFDSVWTDLRLGRVATALDPGETISERTIAALSRQTPGSATAVLSWQAPGSADAVPTRSPRQGPASILSLPHISIAMPGADPPGRELGAAPTSQPDLQIRGLLGEGGMGLVHLARQRSLQRDVAVKVVKPDVNDPGALEALLSEAVTMGRLEHPGIIPVHAVGVDDAGRPLLVMKRIDGVSWQELLRDPDHPAWARLDAPADDRLAAHLQILMQLASALAHAHRCSFVHLDLKPANVMIGELGEVVLVDWGVALPIEREGPVGSPPRQRALRGTPVYMAPEMLSARAGLLDERTDVYLLGATLHTVLTGRPRHEGTTLFEVLGVAYNSRPVDYGPEVPAELAALANRATSAAQADRPPSALAFRRAIADYLSHRSSLALSGAAAARLEELRALPAGDAEAGRAHRLLAECRFGFLQALREWRDNPAAQQGLAACLEAMIEHHLAEGSAVAARALLAELPAARPDLAARLDALEAELAQKSEDAERLRRMERDLDLSHSARGRGVIFLGLGVVTLAMAIEVGRWGGGIEIMTRAHLLGVPSGMLLALTVALAIGRGRLLGNAANRRILGMLCVVLLSIIVHRALALLRGLPPATVLVDDLIVCGALAAASAVTMARPLFAVAALLVGCAALATLRPELLQPAFAAGVLSLAALSLSVLNLSWLRRR